MRTRATRTRWAPRRVGSDAWREACRTPVLSGVFVAVAVAVVGAAFLASPGVTAWHALASAVVLVPTATAAAVDARTLRLPDVLVLPVYPVLALVVLGSGVAEGDGQRSLRVLAAAGLAAGAFGLLHLASPTGLGFGDVKLAPPLAALSAWLGWDGVGVWSVAAFASAAVVSCGLLVTRRLHRGSSVPLGPFLVLGALVTIALAAA